MNDRLPSEWLDWLSVLGYLGLTLFIIWRVFSTQRSE